MKDLCLLIKPSSDNCNMRCKYCFYSDIAEKHCEKYGFMSTETAENLIIKAMEYSEEHITFMFQGGEPTLVGIDFYKTFTDLVKKHNKKNLRVSYAIQTNGYIVDDNWAKFLGMHNFLVGLSLDGTADIHNFNRVDCNDKGTFSRTIKCADILERHKVEFNILTVVTGTLARHGQAVYDFYKKQGYKYLQFIPCLNPIDEMGKNYEYTLTPEDYGRFMNCIFDLWVKDIKNGTPVSIRQFENYIMLMRGMPPESCGFSGMCSVQNVIEADGSVYPCDFYVLDELKLGNINTDSFEKINERRLQLKFIESSTEKPDECKKCEYFPICRNGCKRYCEPFSDGMPSKNYFCEGYKMFFKHSLGELYRLSRY